MIMLNTSVFNPTMLFSLMLFLSLVKGQQCPQVLLASNDITRIEQGQSIDFGGVVLVQQFGGNLQVYTGTVGSLDCLIWETGVCDVPSDDATYFSRIRGRDGSLFTRRDTGAGSSFPFVSPVTSSKGNYFFILNCDGSVGVYNSKTPSAASALWTQEGNACGLSPGCTRSVVMRENDVVKASTGPFEGEGVYIEQMTNGNVVVKRGTPEAPGGILWQSCDSRNPEADYVTSLQADSQFITRPVAAQDTWVWKRDSFVSNVTMDWELALACEGGDFNKLEISDATGQTVVWEADLRPSCDAAVCPNAVLLLDMDQRVSSTEEFMGTGRGYSLLQRSDGILELWKGEPGAVECMLWKSAPLLSPSTNAEAFTVMQNDGNLVTYWKQGSNSFSPTWSTSTGASVEASFTFVIDNCTGGKPRVAVYRRDPITDANAERLWSSEFSDSCVRRELSLRGSNAES